jgi:hypothetical protein
MVTNTFTSVTGASLPSGSGSIEKLYFCAETIPLIQYDTYDTSTNGEWIIRSVG